MAAMRPLYLRNMLNQELHINHSLVFREGKLSIDGQLTYQQESDESYVQMLKRIFRETDKSYSKFHKMDRISKLAFVSSELLLKQIDLSTYNTDNIALVFSNSSATIETDTKFQNSIKEIPSPALFVYTLPNIMVGEICIRNNFKGENLFFVEPKLNTELLSNNIHVLFQNSETELALVGWVDFYSTDKYSACMSLISKNKKGPILTKENLNSQFK